VEIKLECTAQIPKESLARLHAPRGDMNISRSQLSIDPIDPSGNNVYPAKWWTENIKISGQVESFSAEYEVPAKPKTDSGGSWWIGVENSNQELHVIQPVLYWYSDYADVYGIVSESCCPGGHDFRHGDVDVNPGDVIKGSIERTSGTAYSITTTVGGKSYTLKSDTGATMNEPLASMEMYDSGWRCSDLPGGPLTMKDVAISPSVTWKTAQGGGCQVHSHCSWSCKTSDDTFSASPSDIVNLALV